MARHYLSSSQGQDGWALPPFFPGFMAHKFQHILPHQLHRAGGPAEAHMERLFSYNKVSP